MTDVAPDAFDLFLRKFDEDGPHPNGHLVKVAAAAQAEHQRLKAEASIAETAHVHDEPHVPRITTTPLARLMEPAAKGDTAIVLQPRHVASAFPELVVGTPPAQETVTVVRIEGELSPPFPEGPIERKVVRVWVYLAAKLKHSHQARVVVSAPGFDPEDVDASGVTCHDCNQELVSDRGSGRILVCPRVHGSRPAGMLPKHRDGAVECGLPA